MNAEPSEGKRFGKFVLLHELSGGGIGAPWVAYDVDTSDVVVLKRLRKDRVESVHVDRFRDEIRLTFELTHKNLVRARDTGVIDGETYLALDWIQGQNLIQFDERARKYDPITLPVMGAIVLAMCEALGYATMKVNGFVHRDISPGNIVVGYDGIARLIDYGFAMSPMKMARTNAGDVPGTPGFVAPERRFGKADVRSDLYSLASVALFLMTGVRRTEPFANEEEIAQHPLLAIRAPELIPFFGRALALKPDDRFQTVAEFVVMLRSVVGKLATEEQVGDLLSSLFASQKANASEDARGWHLRFGSHGELGRRRTQRLQLSPSGVASATPDARPARIEAPPASQPPSTVVSRPSPTLRIETPLPSSSVDSPSPVRRGRAAWLLGFACAFALAATCRLVAVRARHAAVADAPSAISADSSDTRRPPAAAPPKVDLRSVAAAPTTATPHLPPPAIETRETTPRSSLATPSTSTPRGVARLLMPSRAAKACTTVDKANDALLDGQYAEAARLVSDCLVGAAPNVDALLIHGNAELELGNVSKARSDATRAVALDANNRQARKLIERLRSRP